MTVAAPARNAPVRLPFARSGDVACRPNALGRGWPRRRSPRRLGGAAESSDRRARARAAGQRPAPRRSRGATAGRRRGAPPRPPPHGARRSRRHHRCGAGARRAPSSRLRSSAGCPCRSPGQGGYATPRVFATGPLPQEPRRARRGRPGRRAPRARRPRAPAPDLGPDSGRFAGLAPRSHRHARAGSLSGRGCACPVDTRVCLALAPRPFVPHCGRSPGPAHSERTASR
jgi:hypothetical protein